MGPCPIGVYLLHLFQFGKYSVVTAKAFHTEKTSFLAKLPRTLGMYA